jgi:hypothetical protein
METPPKPSALFHTDGTSMEVTPLGEGGSKIAKVAALLEKILYLLMEDRDEHLPPALKQFFTHLVFVVGRTWLFFLLMMLRKRLRNQRILVHCRSQFCFPRRWDTTLSLPNMVPLTLK